MKKTCRICDSADLTLLFSLGNQFPANNLLTSPKEKEIAYPLKLVQCQHCGLMQLNYVVDKKKLFDHYLYIPSVSKTYLTHMDEMSSGLIKDLSLKKNDVVVDIGGSDGSLLSFFEKKGMNVVNIEPAKNIKSSVYKVEKYFTAKTAKEVVQKFGKAKLVTATNVFAHIDDLHVFLKGLDVLLDTDGVFVAQFPDGRKMIEHNEFDTIYHEHLSYFTTEPLYHLFSTSPFELFRIETSDIHGGSMRIYVRRKHMDLKRFTRDVKTMKKELTTYLKKEKKAEKKIVAFGAAAKGMTLLQYCGLTNKIIDYVADGTPYKQGKFAPGTLIPILPESELTKNPPDIILILAWNFSDEIMKKVTAMYDKKHQVTFVIPIPQVKIIQS